MPLTEPRARIIVLTDGEFAPNIKESDRVFVVRLNVNQTQPMFERVFLWLPVKSQSFVSPVVFLDIDAFLIRPVSELFSSDFDVGLTHRHIVGQMPINEGVVFAN